MTDVFKGSTDQTLFVELVDSSTGLPKTGIVYTDVTGSYSRTRSARVAITMATLASASAAHSDGGFILVDDTNQPGVYRIDVPDAAFATGASEVVITLKATGCRTVSRAVDLVNINNQVAYVPNAAADAAGGLPISDAGGLDLDAKLANTNEVTAARMGALTDWINGGRLDLILDIIAADTTTDIPALIGAAGINLTAVPWNAAWDTEINNALMAYNTTGVASAAAVQDNYNQVDGLITLVNTIPTAAENATAVAAEIAADFTIIKDHGGWLLAINAGAVASPQATSSSYEITINGTVYTSALAGQTDTGVRTAPTLTKV